MFFLFLLEDTARKRLRRKSLVDHQNVNSLYNRHHYVNSSTQFSPAHASYVFLSGYIEVLSQVCICYSYFV